MVITRVATVEEIAQYFMEIAKSDPAIRQLWTRQAGPVVELWILTEPIDAETEKRLRGVRQFIHEKFPATLFDLRLLNARLSDNPDLSFLVPDDAKLFTIH